MEEVKRSFIGITTNRPLTASAEDVRGNVNQRASLDFAISITGIYMDQDVLLSFGTECPKPHVT